MSYARYLSDYALTRLRLSNIHTRTRQTVGNRTVVTTEYTDTLLSNIVTIRTVHVIRQGRSNIAYESFSVDFTTADSPLSYPTESVPVGQLSVWDLPQSDPAWGSNSSEAEQLPVPTSPPPVQRSPRASVRNSPDPERSYPEQIQSSSQDESLPTPPPASPSPTASTTAVNSSDGSIPQSPFTAAFESLNAQVHFEEILGQFVEIHDLSESFTSD